MKEEYKFFKTLKAAVNCYLENDDSDLYIYGGKNKRYEYMMTLREGGFDERFAAEYPYLVVIDIIE